MYNIDIKRKQPHRSKRPDPSKNNIKERIKMKITDGNRTVEINIMTWNGTGYGPDWAEEYFNAGALPYDEEKDAYTVQDVQYCIDMAEGTGEEGARCKYCLLYTSPSPRD